jgi:hypothetical protein
MRLSVLAVGVLTLAIVALPAIAVEGPAHTATANLTLDDLVYGNQSDLVDLGRLVFTTPFNQYDGLGDGPFIYEYPNYIPGKRPTLQNGHTRFLRINGLDAQSCNECHVLVSHETRPPTLGIAGVGGIVSQAIIRPTMLDVADSTDNRMIYQPGHVPDLPLQHDGVADFNGRFANPPFLFGAGGVEMLAKEMTKDLQAWYQFASNHGFDGLITPLITKGVSFGYLKNVNGGVEIHLDGVGPIEIDPAHPEAALVVAPFGRKGENFSVRDFDRGATQFHFGIQPVEVLDVDPAADDQDGVDNEITPAEMGALHMFGVTNPPPVQENLSWQAAHGFLLFNLIGCSYCHRPVLRTASRYLPLAYPEVATDPDANVYREIDLLGLGFPDDPLGPGVLVPLFSDLKRHAMGNELAESLEFSGNVPYGPIEIRNDEFITARLWGIADTAPYLHDGRAPTLTDAIKAHGGEATNPRNRFVNTLNQTQRDHVIAFLMSLRTPGVIAPATLADNPVE